MNESSMDCDTGKEIHEGHQLQGQLIYPHVDRWVTTLLSWWSGQDERVAMKKDIHLWMDEDARIDLAHKTNSIAVLNELVNDPSENVRVALTYNKSLPFGVQRTLLSDDSEMVFTAMGVNTTNSKLKSFYYDTRDKIKAEEEKKPLTKAQKKRAEYLEFKEHVLDTNNVSVNGLHKLSTLAIEEKDTGTLIEIIDHLVCNRNVALSILLSIQHNPQFTYVTEHIILSRFFDFNMLMESIETFSYTYQSIICQFYDLRRLSKVMHCPELMNYLSYY